MFCTIYVYDLITKKYSKKLKSDVSICPPHEYVLLGLNKIMCVHNDRRSFGIWSLENGKVRDLTYESINMTRHGTARHGTAQPVKNLRKEPVKS